MGEKLHNSFQNTALKVLYFKNKEIFPEFLSLLQQKVELEPQTPPVSINLRESRINYSSSLKKSINKGQRKLKATLS